MSTFYAVGGVISEASNQDVLYEKAVVCKVDLTTKAKEIVFSWKTRPENAPVDKVSSVFKAAHFKFDIAYLCTLTEVLICKVPSFEVVKVISLPVFNDLHYVHPTKNNTLLVVSTGLDAVFEIDLEGNLLNEWSALQNNIWDRFDKSVDYRKVESTKPHESHPNYCFELDGEIYATRFHQHDAICLTADKPKFNIEIGRIHDGVQANGDLHFTEVTGHVVRFKDCNPDKKEVYKLGEFYNINNALGWCRSIEPINSNEMLVGFSMFRATNIVGNLRGFVRDVFKGEILPTRVAKIDLDKKLVIDEVKLKPELNTVFSIHLI